MNLHKHTHTHQSYPGFKAYCGMIGNNQLKMLRYKDSSSASSAWQSVNQDQSTGPICWFNTHTHTHISDILGSPRQT